MNAPNDSVIICDSPSSSTTTEWTAIRTNYRKRLRSNSGFKTLLGTYQSPLGHLRRIVPNDTINADDNDVTVVSTPVAKRYKRNVESKTSKEGLGSSSLDQSIMILNSTSPEPTVDLAVADARTDDISEVNTTSKSVVSSMGKTSRKIFESPIKNRSSPKQNKKMLKKNNKNPKNTKTARAAIDCLKNNDENHNGQNMEESTNGQSEDIEVVWVSGPNMETTSDTTASIHQPIVIDKQRYLGDLVQSVPLYTKKSKNKTHPRRLMRQKKKLRPRDKCTESTTTNNQYSRISHVPANEDNARLREIVIDGCNIAYGHTNGRDFSEKGIQIVVDYFRDRNHVVTAFLPQSVRSKERTVLERLHKNGNVVFTPSRKIGGRDITPYDDRFILEYATKCDGIVVSSDQYRDLWQEKPQWRNTIENRLLTPTFVGDYLMFPEDPLGRRGPKLKDFLRH